jgi:hypothetical protein
MCEVRTGSGPWRTVASGLAVQLLVAGAADVAEPNDRGASAVSRPRSVLEEKIPGLMPARQGARERLGRPECQAVLADFKDGSGRRLDEVLRATGRTAQEQLDLLVLESGFGRQACNRGVLASTSVHSSEVFICLRPFTLLPAREQEAVLIHEMLHSLGLGENPPESVAITEQVLKRCGHLTPGPYLRPSAR